MKDFLAAVGVIVIALPTLFFVAIAMTAWRAWWFYPAWEWFIVPFGVPRILFWHFTALMLLVSTMTMHGDHYKEERKTDWGKVVIGFLLPIITWAMLWWLHNKIGT